MYILLIFKRPRLSAEEFVHFVHQHIRPSTVVLGYDFRFGAGGKGNFEIFKEVSRAYNCTVLQADALIHHDQPISSSRIRTALSDHEIQEANLLLGQPYSCKGIVVQGRQIGRSLGIPTANIATTTPPIVPEGIYAGTVTIASDERRYVGAISFSTNPTIDQESAVPILEVFLLDFDQDIYGKHIEVQFEHWVRAPEKFSSLEELRTQMNKDIQAIKQLYA